MVLSAVLRSSALHYVYISASIIIQLLIWVKFIRPRRTEERRSLDVVKISQYTRYGTLVLAIFQSISIATVF